ncbi:MAG: hypothetical protein MJ123_08240 [Lachnospiraceae bacterium]|nr:hypothetical protein [Lachnospiraceae bacterium]
MSSEGYLNYAKCSRDTLSKLEGIEMNDDFFAFTNMLLVSYRNSQVESR